MVPGKERHKREPIADRWQRLSNLSESMKGFFLNKQAQLKALVQKPAEDLSEEEARQLAPWQTSMRKHLEAKSLQLHQERVTRYQQIHGLSAKKVDVATIARQVGVSRQCVYEYLRLQQPPERTHIPPSRQPMLEPYKDYLVRRWNEGCRNAQQAYREVKEQGYPGGDSNIVRFFGHLRKHFDQSGTFKQVDPATQTSVQAPPKRPPTASKASSLDDL
jgi:transposase